MTRHDIPDPANFDNAQNYICACAQWLLAEAYNYDVIVTIDRVPLQPLAMRNFVPRIQTRDQR